MPSFRLLAVAVLAAGLPGVGAAAGPAERIVIPYLSGGAGVFLDEEGRPVSSEGAPRVPGVHFRPPVDRNPEPSPQPEPDVPVAPPPSAPAAAPPAPPAEGYARPELAAAVAVPAVTTVFCRTDAAWPADASLGSATGYWTAGGSTITLRTWRCDGIAREKIGSEPFARGLFVLAQEAAHAAGVLDECEADKTALATMGAITARLGWGFAAGDEAGRYLNELLRANPPPDPYCIGRLP